MAKPLDPIALSKEQKKPDPAKKTKNKTYD